jgi:hypothetical protein
LEEKVEKQKNYWKGDSDAVFATTACTSCTCYLLNSLLWMTRKKLCDCFYKNQDGSWKRRTEKIKRRKKIIRKAGDKCATIQTAIRLTDIWLPILNITQHWKDNQCIWIMESIADVQSRNGLWRVRKKSILQTWNWMKQLKVSEETEEQKISMNRETWCWPQ